MSKHTPEPWYVEANFIVSGLGDIDTRVNVYDHDAANRDRIVACVNACAGMDDPAAEITRLRARLAAWKAEAEAWRQADDCDPMVRGECIREARERRAATDAIEKNAS